MRAKLPNSLFIHIPEAIYNTRASKCDTNVVATVMLDISSGFFLLDSWFVLLYFIQNLTLTWNERKSDMNRLYGESGDQKAGILVALVFY